MMNLKSLFLSEKDIEKVYVYALEEYPEECCGVIIGSPSGKTENVVCRCANIQNQLHQKDPVRYPRDAKTAYCIDPGEFMDILKKVENKDMEIKAFYHSHPDHDVYFSEEDKKNALVFDAPAYPDAVYMIVSVFDNKIKGTGFFKWDKGKGVFSKIPY